MFYIKHRKLLLVRYHFYRIIINVLFFTMFDQTGVLEGLVPSCALKNTTSFRDEEGDRKNMLLELSETVGLSSKKKTYERFLRETP